MTITTDLGSKTLDEITGLHEDSQTTLKDLQDSLQQILTIITGMSSDGGEKMTEKVGNKVKSTVGNEDAKTANPNDLDSRPAKISDKIQLSDLSGLSNSAVMGALLINTTLLELKASLESMLQQIISNQPTGKNAKSLSKESKKENNANKKISGPDPKAFKDLAESLKIFAVGAVILSLVPQGIVKKATESFAIFIDRMVDSASKLEKNMKNFSSFATGIKAIIDSLKHYTVAVILLAITLPLAPIALLNVGFMSLMILMLSKVGAMAKATHPFITEIVKAFVLMGVAFILYGIAMNILINVGKNFKESMIGLLAMIAFIGTVILTGLLCTYALMALTTVMTTFILLGVAMILFSIAINIMQKIEVNQEAINNVMTAIKAITIGFSSMMGMVFGALATMVGFLLFSIIFTVAILTFNIGLILLVVTNLIMGLLGTDDKGNFIVVERIKTLIGQFAKGETLASFALGTLTMVFFTLFSTLFAIGILIFTLGAAFLFLTDFLLKDMTKEDDNTNIPVSRIIIIAEQMVAGAGMWLLGSIVMIPAIVFALELAVFAGLAALASAALVEVKKNIEKLGSLEEINKIGKTLSEAGVGIMLGFLGVSHEPGEPIKLTDLLVGGKNAIQMAALGVIATLAIAPMAAFMIAAKEIGKSFVSLEESMSSVRPETVEMVFGGLTTLMDSLANVAESFRGQSAETITAIGGMVKNVAEAMNLITDVVIKLKDGIPEEDIDAATAAMLQICERLFGRADKPHEEGRYTLCDTLETIASADLANLNVEAVQAITPLMDGIDRMAEVVIKLSDKDIFSEEAITTGINNMNLFLEAMGAVSTAMMSLIKKEGTGERQKKSGFLGWLGFTEEIDKSPLEAIQEVNDSGFFSTFESVIGGLKKAGLSLQDFDVSSVGNVVEFLKNSSIGDFSLGSTIFATGMTNFANGLSKLNDNAITRFQNFIAALSNAGNESFKNSIDSLLKLGNAANKFQSIAKSMGDIADAMTKMASKKKDLVSIYEAIANSHPEKTDITTPTNATAAVGGVTFNPYVEKIYNVLTDWNENGIPVRGQLDKETGEFIPTPAGNGVGQNGARK
jgi:hypothetical protein